MALAAAALFCGRPLAAQVESNGEPPTAEAAYRDGEIRIDGRPDETVWQKAMPVTEFVQGEPVENAPAEQPTEVRVLFDPAALYVSAIMHDPEPTLIGDQLVRRDENGQYDYFEFSLDSNNDRRTGYRFRVSAAGVQRDVYMYDDVREDPAWDAVWQSAVQRDSDGWSAELRIPLSQLRYNTSDSAQSWGVNFSRRRLASNEVTYFALESRVQYGKVSAFGRLDGLRLPHSARRIEVRPYALGRAHTAPAEAEDPFFDGSEVGSRIGLDVRYGLGAGFTLDATFNPDFGQVEVDPAVINLTAFETFFPEKRPFFVEDAQIFEFRLAGRTNELFYSRRIGREPQGSAPDDADFEKLPGETTILGAAKLTGRSSSGLSLAALAAITSEETGRAFFSDAAHTEEFVVEPLSEYGVLRVRQDFRSGASQVGAILTAMHREPPGDGSLDDLTSSAYSLGLDFEHNWGGSSSRDWAIQGFLAGSLIQGSTAALLRVQESSNHYFQRPDATRYSVDSTATSMSGVNWRLELERQSAKHWTGAVWIAEVSSGFEIGDLGFMQGNDRLDAGFRVGYHEIAPGYLFRSYRISLSTYHNWRHEALDDALSWSSWKRAHETGWYNLRSHFEFLNYWSLELNARYSPESQSDSETRGGPLMIRPGSTSFEASLGTDRRGALYIQPTLEYQNGHQGGYRWESQLQIVVRPTPSLEIQLEPQFASELDPAQYVTTTDDVAYEPTYGHHYLFSDLRRRQLSLETRLNMTFNPKLTFQLFAQPLISSGDYLAYKQLQEPESFDFDVFEEGAAAVAGDEITCVGGRTCVSDDERYVDFDGDGSVDDSFSDEDFNVRSLRLSAVLRWEYLPGSTLFLVWQHNRRERADIGSFDLDRDLDALWAADSENAFILKVNYWLGL
ncbi:MAG: hypothetical protein AMS25_03355 [Gemmatimonas sp. SM23_52]|nr:MAG: hypothetical protein AMS25_03355 [Gemmatimonas sp. SM23_52]